jgi:hypothetical protein
MFKYLFLVFLIIVFVPQVRQFVFYLLVGRQLVNEQKRQQEAQNRKATPDRTRPGSTKVDFVPPGATDSRTKGGDYVDYEEIK